MNRKVILILVVAWLVVTFLCSGYTGAMDQTFFVGLPFHFFVRAGKMRDYSHINSGFHLGYLILDVAIALAFILLINLLIAFLAKEKGQKYKPN